MECRPGQSAEAQRPGHLRPVPLPVWLSARLDSDPATRHGHVRDAVVRRRRMPLRMAAGAGLAGWQLLLDGRARGGGHQLVRHRGTHQRAGRRGRGRVRGQISVGAGDALTYQGITALTGAAGDSQWGSAAPDPGGRGWWLTGTRDTGGTGCVADCKTMDTAFVPFAGMAHPSAWHVQLGVLPAGVGYDLGTVVSMSHVSGRGWVAYTKREPAPGCGRTYSAETRPASPAPRGTMLVSWASSHDDPGTTCDIQSQFTDLPIGSPPPRADSSGCGPPTGGDIRFPLRPRTETIVPGVSSSERKGGAVDVRPDSRAFRRPLTPGGRRHLPRGEMP
jgi:hypothetical protein